jgi:hypothetical protein
MAFVEKLDGESLAFFNSVCEKPFAEQAVAFLNAYWAEIGDQAEFIMFVAWESMKYCDMEAKGISLIHKYQEGVDLEFDIGLRFYEYLCQFLQKDSNAKWTADEYKKSQPEIMTAIVRKKELRDKVDVNFDNRISMLEYLLYQYREWANPADFATRSMSAPDEHPEITKARLALEEVNKKIQEYEAYKQDLEKKAEGTGVKALGAKNLLAQLGASPLAEALNRALITAEAAVRIATRKFGGKGGGGAAGDSGANSDGALWWMNRDLEEKKKKYGRR